MKLYFSMPIAKNLWLTKIVASLHNSGYEINLMLSYWYHRNKNIRSILTHHFNEPYPDIIADSGAFTAMTKGKDINIDSYCQWIHKQSLSSYINLDVIGNAQQTYRNQKVMESNKLSPIPVFHIGSSSEYLEKYLEDYQTIGLGGLVPVSKSNCKTFLDKCFYIADNKPIYHGFGISSYELIQRYNWQSVDSSAYGSSFRFGNVIEFGGRTFVKRKRENETKEKLSEQSILAWIKAIEWRNRNGFTKITSYQKEMFK